MEGKEVTWEDIKKLGSAHYKTDGVEPIDLYRSLGILRHHTIAAIIKYAARNVNTTVVSEKDIEKIRHYASMLRFC